MFASHAWYHHVIWIAWHEDIFSCWGRDESLKVPDPDCRAGAQEFPSSIIPKRFTVAWAVREVRLCHATTAPSCLTSEASCVERESGLISSRIDCFIRRRKVQQKHTMHVPKHSRHHFPRAGWCLEFLKVGDPGCFQAVDCTFVSGQYWCTQVSFPVMICSKKSAPWSLKRRRWVRGAPIRVSLWSSVSCRGTPLMHTCLYPKRSWTMSPDCATWRIKLFFQLFKQHSAISMHSLLNCRDKICWCGRTPIPLFICYTHATATKFPTPFSHMLHGHHISPINCLNFNWSWPFCSQKPNNWSKLFLCPHTQYSSHCGTASSTKIAELELRKCFYLATNVWPLSE